jgi:hypothetical protein
MANTNAQGKIPNVAQHGFGSFRTDLFGRIKTAEAYTVFEAIHRYEKSADFSEYTAGTASIAYIENQSALSLSVGTASGDIATLETFKVMPFQTGKSLQVMNTFTMAPEKANLRQRVGYFSRQNGVYLELDGTTTYIVWRSYVSGSVVNTRIAQNDWNIDQLNGDGPSDYALDLTHSQLFWIELSSMGSGEIRVGFNIDGYFIPVHQINNSNNRDTPLFTTASLPIRYEIENTGATSSASYMTQMNAAVISNGGFYKQKEQFTVVTSGEVTVGESYTPLIALRLAAGRTDAVITSSALNIYPVSADDFEWALMRNPTTLIGGTWTTFSPRNNVQYNKTATSMSGGVPLFEGFFGSQNQNPVPMAEQSIDNFAYQMGRTNSDSPVSDVFVLCCRVVQGTGTVKASLSWHDLI